MAFERGARLDNPARVCIVGGGFTGAAVAVQLVRASTAPLAIEIVEPREELGRGLAYTAPDPDWRLNGGIDTHGLDLTEAGRLAEWCRRTGASEGDPAAVAKNGNIFVRRHDFGSFARDEVFAHSRSPNGSAIRHVRDVAIDAEVSAQSVKVQLRSATAIESDLLVIATGNASARLPVALANLSGDSRVMVDALDADRLRAIPREARILLLGSGLTALDVASTLVRRGHEGPIVSVSRRGLRPQAHPLPAPSAGPSFLERVEGPLPAFVRDAPRTARGLLRALRQRIREVERDGGTWYAAFDAMRDVLWQVWPTLTSVEKRRTLRWLRPWYDTHRFRAPPQNDALVRAAEAEGRVFFRVARVNAVEAREDALHARLGNQVERFDYLVNCTGLDPAAGARDNPLLVSLLERGLIEIDPSGIGFAVDGQCRPIVRDGIARDRLRMFGPPTAGTFGDPLGVLFIAPQIRRAMPAMLATLAAVGSK